MRVTVLGGSGQTGRVAVGALLAQGTHVTVADRVPPPADVAIARFEAFDASSSDDLRHVIEPADAVMNFVGPYYRFGTAAARCAIELRTPYIDVCDDADVAIDLLGLVARAEDAGVPVVTGVGGSPGVLNMLACIAAADFTAIDQLLTAWVVEPHAEGGPAVLAHTIHCVADPIASWRDGRLVVDSALYPGTDMAFTFPAPVGRVRVRAIGHPEPVTLSRHLDAVEIRTLGGIVPEAALDTLYALARLGLGSTDPLQVGPVQVTPRDFLAAFLASHGHPVDPAREKIALGVKLTGRRNGRDAVRWLSYANHATLADVTAIPAVAGLNLMTRGAVPPGVHGPEALDPAAWLDELDRLRPGLYHRFDLVDDHQDGEPLLLTARQLGNRWQKATTLPKPTDS